MNRHRVEAFSDGVFAIAITLLVLTIAQPSNYHHLTQQLGQRWPSLVAYLVSFMVIGVMWLNHHTIFSHLERIDRTMFYLNLTLLMTIVFLPYPTEVFGEALRQHHGARAAAVFYSLLMVVNATVWAAIWLYMSVGRRLLTPQFPESERTTSTVLFAMGPLPYATAVGIAFWNPYLCLAFHGMLVLYYAFDPISRRLERTSSG